MTDRPADAALEAVAAAVATRFTWGGFVLRGSTLTRTTAAGLPQVVAFYRNYGGPPAGQGGDPELNAATSFQVQLGAKLLPGSTPRRAHFLGLDADVTINLGQTRREGSHPDFALHRPDESVARVVRLLEPYGRRWFQRHESLDTGIEALEKLYPTAVMLAGDYPVLTAMRLRAARGEWDAVAGNLEALVVRGGPGLDPRLLQLAVDHATTLGLPAEHVPVVVRERLSDAPPVGLRPTVLADAHSAGYESLPAVRDWLVHATEDERLAAHDDIWQLLADRRAARYRESLHLAGVGTARTARQAVDALRDGGHHRPQLLVDVLLARDVGWLAEFVALWAAEHPVAARATVDLLADAGLVERPDSTEYRRAMIFLGPRPLSSDRMRSLLLTAPETAGRDIVELLSAEGVGADLHAFDGDPGPDDPDATWTRQLARLVAEGLVPRQEVVDLCVARIVHGSERTAVSWFIGLYDELRPTASELTRHVGALIAALDSERSTVVALAQSALLAGLDAGSVDAADLVSASAGPLARKEKKLVLAQLQVLRAVARGEPRLQSHVVDQARAVLDHERADVRAAAAQLVRSGP